jgi:oxygen-dependent protoporphyrinogen oxidase
MAKQIVILGAGISGLTAAWYLKKKHGSTIEITVVEKTSRPGGWIQTEEVEGFLFEKGPRSCRTKGNGRATLELIEELGLQAQVIGSHPEASQRYLYLEKQLQKLPTSFVSLPFSTTLKGWMKAAWRDLRTAAGPPSDQSIYEFFTRRIGAEWTDRFIDPLVAGIYAGDIHRLSIQSCFPLFYEWEQKQGSLIKGAFCQLKKSPSSSAFVKKMEKFPIFSFKKGMATLPQALNEQLDAHMIFNVSALKMEPSPEGVKVFLSDGRVIDAHQVISTLPPTDLPYATVAVVNIGFRQSLLKEKGFGYLIPSKEKEAVLGCVFDSCVFPEQNGPQETRLTVMLGGAHHPQVSQWTNRECLAFAQSALSRHLGINAMPDAISVSIAHQAIPQFEVGHGQWVANYKKQYESARFKFLGSAFSGVAVNDCIAYAKELAINT